MTCTGGGNNQCIECDGATNYILADASNVCGTCDTTNKKYVDGYYCRSCHSSCKIFKALILKLLFNFGILIK